METKDLILLTTALDLERKLIDEYAHDLDCLSIKLRMLKDRAELTQKEKHTLGRIGRFNLDLFDSVTAMAIPGQSYMARGLAKDLKSILNKLDIRIQQAFSNKELMVLYSTLTVVESNLEAQLLDGNRVSIELDPIKRHILSQLSERGVEVIDERTTIE